jgi:hypothetical protein
MMESTAEQNRAIDTQHVGGSAWPAELDATPTARRSGDLSSATTPNQVLAIVSVGVILTNLDLFVVNVTLPNIALDFANPSLERLSWILNGYTIAYAALLVFFGRLSECYPRNVSFLVGIGAFTAASAACAAATDTEMLVVIRVVQAAAAALMTPTSLGLLLSAFPPEGRSGAVRTWTATGGVAAALGPLIGGGELALDLPRLSPDRADRPSRRLAKTPESSWPQQFTPPFWSSASGDRRCGVLGFRDRQDKRLGLAFSGHHCRDGHFPRVVRCALSSVVRPFYRSAPVPHPSVHGSRAGYRSVFGGLWRAFAVDGVVGSDDLGLVGSEDRSRDCARPAADTRRLASIFAPTHSPIRHRRGLRRGDDFIRSRTGLVVRRARS